MSEQKFFVEDTVCLRNDRKKIGVIDIETHIPNPRADYGDSLQKGPGVSSRGYKEFNIYGVPPKGTVLVTYAVFPWSTEIETVLTNEDNLILLDRALMDGDVVKRSARDAMSGTVIAGKCTATLLQPKRWSAAGQAIPKPPRGNFPGQPVNMLRDVPVSMLQYAAAYMEEEFVGYKGWVGRVVEHRAKPLLRLANNSVVIPEDDAELDSWITSDQLAVGDTVSTTKANLRRGEWIYGAYNADVPAVGYVAAMRTDTIGIDWLTYGMDGHPPIGTLEREEIESDELRVFDRESQSNADGLCMTIQVQPGDRVRWRDVGAAADIYTQSHPNGYFDRIARTESLGFDINVFLVVTTKTTLRIRWQDGTETDGVEATSCVPYLDLSLEDEIWPGELVATKYETEGEELIARQVGVVWNVAAQDRTCNVKWMNEPKLIFTKEDAPILIPGSWTSPASQTITSASMYDVSPIDSLSRRIGDFVAICEGQRSFWGLPWYSEVVEILGRVEPYSWFGEIVDLGRDGRLHVRMLALSPPVMIKAPWECTIVLYSSDDESDDDDGSDDDYNSELDSADESATFTNLINTFMPAQHEHVNDGASVESWETEEEGSDVEMQSDGSERHEEAPQAAPLNTGLSLQFEVLDGSPPEDFHWPIGDAYDTKNLRRLGKEHKALRSSLPEGVYVKSWESSLASLRFLMIGPSGTPYEFAPFVFDMHLGTDYPHKAPQLFFHSWTDGSGPINPNLYENGTVCLSLLGTWAGMPGECWTTESTLLQIIVSILGLVLVKEPYFNEAGYEVRRGTVEAEVPSRHYSERAYLRSRSFIASALQAIEPGTASSPSQAQAVKAFTPELVLLYYNVPSPSLSTLKASSGSSKAKQLQLNQPSSLLYKAISSAINTISMSQRISGLLDQPFSNTNDTTKDPTAITNHDRNDNDRINELDHDSIMHDNDASASTIASTSASASRRLGTLRNETKTASSMHDEALLLSAGAVSPLCRQLTTLIELLESSKYENSALAKRQADELRRMLEEVKR